MASTSTRDINDNSRCPVCMDDLTDPRILSCGHHFCKSCLDSIVENNTRHEIPCPTCRHVTKHKVSDLPKFKINKFRAKIRNFVDMKPARIHWKCNYCQGSEVPKFSCSTCKVMMCEACKPKHDPLEEPDKHQVEPASQNQICEIHRKFMLWICKTCAVAVCPLCAPDHNDHAMVEILAQAADSRKTLQKNILDSVCLTPDEIAVKEIELVLQRLSGNWLTGEKLFKEMKAFLTELLRKLDVVEKHSRECVVSEAKSLKALKRDAQCHLKSKADLIRHTKEMISSYSSVDLCLRASLYPKHAAANFIDTIKKTEAKLPVSTKLGDAMKELQRISAILDEENIVLQMFSKVLGSVTTEKEFEMPFSGTKSLALSTEEDVMVVRFSDNISFAELYKCAIDDNLSLLSKGNIASDSHISKFRSEIAIDKKRNLFMLPDHVGNILTIPINKQHIPKFPTGRINVNNCDALHGIAYSAEDLYVTSSAITKSVYVVDPKSKQVLSSFRPNTQFYKPVHLACGTYNSPEGLVSAIAVSDPVAHCVKVLDMSGRLLKVYGQELYKGKGRRDRIELDSPTQVSMDSGGRLLVCDTGNKRVIMMWEERGVQKQKCLKSFQGSPEMLQYIPEQRRLLVVEKYSNSEKLVILKESD